MIYLEVVKMAVMCRVDNCHYWSSGNHYPSSQILVISNQVDCTTDDTYDSPRASTSM
ncbi:MAG: DUF1540 domain-containing protein [Bacillota bacterium]